MSKTFWLAALVVVALHWVIHHSDFTKKIDYGLYDIFSGFHQKKIEHPSTLIVDIDEQSLEQMGQWPWPRLVLAKIIDAIAEHHPSSIGLDILFPEPDRTSPRHMIDFYQYRLGLDVSISGIPEMLQDHDSIFAESIRRSPVILPVYLTNTPASSCNLSKLYEIQSNTKYLQFMDSKSILCNLPALQDAARGFGFINAAQDQDGIFRRTPLLMKHQDKIVPSLGFSMLLMGDSQLHISEETLQGNLAIDVLDKTIFTDEKSQTLLNFYPRSSYSVISAQELLNGTIDPASITGKMVLIGTSAAGLHDLYTMTGGMKYPGVYVHATLIENFRHGDLIVQPAVYKNIDFMLAIFLSFLMIWWLYQREYLRVILLVLSVYAGSIMLAFALFQMGLYVSLGFLLVPFTLLFLLCSLLYFLHGYREKKLFFEELSRSHTAAIDAMAYVAETRDNETGMHIIRTKKYIRLLAEYLSEQGIYSDVLTPYFIEILYTVAPLHDVGKVGIEDLILKKPGKLEFTEFERMKMHTVIGKNIIEDAMKHYQQNTFLKTAFNIAYCHHEKWDGSGYPNGLKGEEIPLEARLMAISDVYDALISKRVYKPSFTIEKAEEIIIEGRGTHFDPKLVDAFIEIKEEFKTIAAQHQETKADKQ